MFPCKPLGYLIKKMMVRSGRKLGFPNKHRTPPNRSKLDPKLNYLVSAQPWQWLTEAVVQQPRAPSYATTTMLP